MNVVTISNETLHWIADSIRKLECELLGFANKPIGESQPSMTGSDVETKSNWPDPVSNGPNLYTEVEKEDGG